MRPDLSTFENSWYNPGGTALGRLAWYFINALFFINPLNPSSGLKVRLLRLFGAKVGKGVVIKPGVNVKYPWRLSIGDHSWIGERAWLDSLDYITIGSDCCVSQGAMLLTGNHNYKKASFDLVIRPIELRDGSWVGAQCTVCPGAVLGEGCILAVGSVAMGSLEADSVYQGNPAVRKRSR